MKKLRNAMLGLLIALTVVIVGLCLSYKYMISPVSKKSEIVDIEIPAKASTRYIAKLLKENDLIRNEDFFLFYTRLFKVNDLKHGYYTLNKNMGVEKIVEELRKSSTKNPNAIMITIKEGQNIRDIAKTISTRTNLEYNDIIEKVNDKKYLDTLIEKYWFLTDEIKQDGIIYGLEGYLYPETYRIESKDESIESILEIILNVTNNILSEVKTDIEKSGMTVHETLTVASMIEKEFGRESDRSSISEVFHNRVKLGMSLGSDVTARYANKIDNSSERLNDSEYNLASPYNTRLTDGSMNGKLPIGPIANPPKESILAAIYPSNEGYIYFVANLKTKETFFYDNYADFNKKKIELDPINKGL